MNNIVDNICILFQNYTCQDSLRVVGACGLADDNASLVPAVHNGAYWDNILVGRLRKELFVMIITAIGDSERNENYRYLNFSNHLYLLPNLCGNKKFSKKRFNFQEQNGINSDKRLYCSSMFVIFSIKFISYNSDLRNFCFFVYTNRNSSDYLCFPGLLPRYFLLIENAHFINFRPC